MTRLMVDTSVWVAYAVEGDVHSKQAKQIIDSHPLPVVTIWPVVWETLNLLVFRRLPRQAVALGRRFISGRLSQTIHPAEIDCRLALDLMEKFEGHRLSAVDALCCVMARRLNIRTVASFDQHFRLVLTERTVIGLE